MITYNNQFLMTTLKPQNRRDDSGITRLRYGEGSGTPLQYSCLENPMDGGAWKAAIHGVAEGQRTERLHFHCSVSCIGEGNGNPFQCTCLENPRDGGAWWAAFYGTAQSQTRLTQLSSSSNYALNNLNILVNELGLMKGTG